MTQIMKPADRHKWLLDYIAALPPQETVDVCSADFVNDYLDATKASAYIQPYGAHRCPSLGRDLSALYKQRRLKRERSSIEGMGGMGFPTWVWCYQLSRMERMFREKGPEAFLEY
ncbi:hypothetical protein HOU00_gp180 [Caulobacter phage CcrPW]|uniref:Uncharacterized protein n=1 Tax=Caulobacter phage CcrPW TaxID=2283271 RepID=A0A385ED66_9CAUD|nr:hypothetical protein HOU00_gp180 [Caulobacter phage CcrPW]AXQ68945.1 hypothetical protein CcrPW_gp406 [Caulobacter phage CcrPW]